jgi:hypothetical protein
VTAQGVTVRFWLETSPPRGAAVKPDDEVIIRVSCSTANDSDQWLTVVIDPIAPDGSVVTNLGTVPDIVGGMTNVSLPLTLCRTGFTSELRPRLPSSQFATIARLRTKAFVRPKFTQGNVGSELASTPEAIVFDSVNWQTR